MDVVYDCFNELWGDQDWDHSGLMLIFSKQYLETMMATVPAVPRANSSPSWWCTSTLREEMIAISTMARSYFVIDVFIVRISRPLFVPRVMTRIVMSRAIPFAIIAMSEYGSEVLM